MERVCTGELRGTAGEVVTIAIDAADTPRVDPTRRYRLVTLPVNDRPDREFASLLRAAEETFSTVTVEAGSPLHGMAVGAIALTITAIRPDDGDPVPFPGDEYRLAPGDLLFVIATPGELRRLEAGATALDPSIASSEALDSDQAPPEEGIQTGEPTATAREEPTGADGLPASDEQAPGETSEREPTASDPDESSEEPIAGKAGSDSFKEIKANFEETDPGDTTEATAETAEGSTSESADGDSTSFDELKSEFESGEADWEDDAQKQQPQTDATDEEDDLPDSDDIEIAFAEDGDDKTGDEQTDDELVGLDEAEISFEDDDSESDEREDDGGDGELVGLDEAEISFEDDDSESGLGGVDIDDDLQGEDGDSISDDIGDLEFEEESGEDVSELDLSEEEGLFSDVEEESDSDADDGGKDEEESADDEEGDDDDEDSSGGGTSFAQLKEEFESGEADWEDDVSDSPGGDMRLDE
nr:TrkA C-terminal domain-containing protein [Halovenus carboxidivorans]